MRFYAYNSFKGGLLSERVNINRYAKEHGINIRRMFSDKSAHEKDGLYSLFETMEKSDIKTVLVYSIQSL